MSLARLKRLQRLESRRPSAKPWSDDSPWVIPIFQALFEGRPFEWIPRPERERIEEEEQALALRMRELDRLAERLEQNDPGGAARFQGDVERKRTANLRAIECEQAARGA